MKKINHCIILALVLVLSFIVSPDVFGAEVDLKGDILNQIEASAESAELGTAQDPRLIVATVIRVMLSLIGTIFFVLMIYAGYLWLTSRGEEDKVQKAKKIITRSVVGLIVILVSYSITLFVGGALEAAILDR